MACVASLGRMAKLPAASSRPLNTTKNANESQKTTLPSSARRAYTKGEPPQVSKPAPMSSAPLGDGPGATMAHIIVAECATRRAFWHTRGLEPRGPEKARIHGLDEASASYRRTSPINPRETGPLPYASGSVR